MLQTTCQQLVILESGTGLGGWGWEPQKDWQSPTGWAWGEAAEGQLLNHQTTEPSLHSENDTVPPLTPQSRVLDVLTHSEREHLTVEEKVIQAC